MADVVGKLTTGEPLSVDQLIEYLPALKEIPRGQLDNWAKGAAVLHRYRKGEIVIGLPSRKPVCKITSGMVSSVRRADGGRRGECFVKTDASR